jgi:hypothetical protein
VNFLKAFPNRRKIGPGLLSKLMGTVLLIFQKRVFNQKHIWRVLESGGPGPFFKALGEALRNLLSTRSKGFNLTAFKISGKIKKLSAL